MDVKNIIDVWGRPADFNRAARRAAGLFGRFWKWDARAIGVDPNTPPRYVRRHHRPELLTNPKTRRDRRRRSRILKSMSWRV